VVEEEGAGRVAQIHQELERVKEELVEVRGVVEEQRGVLRDREEERERLSQAAVSGERDREDQRDRQHREDTASLAILQKQLSALTNEKQDRGVERSSDVREEGVREGEEREEDTLTPPPPPPTTTPAPGHTGEAESVASTGSVMWTKSATNLGSLLGQTPSDDSGLASQQASVANSEATLVVTPMVEDSDETQTSAGHRPHQPPNLTILPLDDTAVSLQDHSQVPGLSYDQSQLGMLSVSFLDATHHSTHHPPPSSSSLALQTDLMSVSALDQSLLPLNLSHLPSVQGVHNTLSPLN
jgi:hypothetical protein